MQKNFDFRELEGFQGVKFGDCRMQQDITGLAYAPKREFSTTLT